MQSSAMAFLERLAVQLHKLFAFFKALLAHRQQASSQVASSTHRQMYGRTKHMRASCKVTELVARVRVCSTGLAHRTELAAEPDRCEEREASTCMPRARTPSACARPASRKGRRVQSKTASSNHAFSLVSFACSVSVLCLTRSAIF